MAAASLGLLGRAVLGGVVIVLGGTAPAGVAPLCPAAGVAAPPVAAVLAPPVAGRLAPPVAGT
jgi:hypothetical protein